MNINTAPQFEFAETAERFNHRISKDTKGPFHPATKKKIPFFVICLAFTCFVVTRPIPPNDAKISADVLLRQGRTFLAHRKH